MPPFLRIFRDSLVCRQLIFACVSFVSCFFALQLATFAGNVSPLWPPTGIAIGLAWLFGYRALAGMGIGVFFAIQLAGGSLPIVLVGTIANVTEAALGVFLMRCLLEGEHPFGNIANIIRFFLICAFVAPAVSASIGVAGLYVEGFASVNDLAELWTIWWLGNLMGAVLFTPVIISWSYPFEARNYHLKEAVVIASVAVGMAALILTKTVGVADLALMASFPIVAWSAVRNGARIASSVAMLTGVVTVLNRTSGDGPIATFLQGDSVAPLYGFLLILMGIALMIPAAMRSQKIRELATSQSQSDLLASTSHEIRTPLTAIYGFAELILSDPQISEKDRQRLEIILRNCRHLSTLIDDIIDLAKADAKGVDLEIRHTSLRELLDSVMDTVKSQAESKGLELCLHVAPEVPATIETDDTRLRQILINIVHNAIKFTDSGSVTLSVDLDAGQDPKQLVCRVKDTGVGISAKHQADLFEPFSQGPTSTYRERGGSGLGLCLSRKLARMLGGDLILEQSAEGEGSVFKISVSLPQSSEKEESRLPLAGKNILVVEDNEDCQLLFAHLLRKKGAVVEVASDGLEGERKAIDGRFHLILMDLQLPHQDGYTTTSHLREMHIGVPILALSASTASEERERCLAGGYTEFVCKSSPTDTIIDAVEKWALN